ncbi:2'-5' RNA ligase family protein [Pedobacter sp. SYSU D00535]|uniref:2'-5' RNA ligase family protein n=1 Tax=Pedobacter sp. SYSU D00535 TaxID=2810308 RepID=UPI001A95A8EF|nr:2'-5' RNA ligase family protein [Pedobacter sp. SYSU D00535]
MKNNDYYEYLAIIQPNRKVRDDVMDMKIRCKRQYWWDAAVSSKPHFTVFNIIQPAFNESRLTACLQRNVSNISPFQIELSGFDCFHKTTCTLYVRLKDENPFSEMTRYIQKSCSPVLKHVKGNPHRFIKTGHLTVAKGIPKAEFKGPWESWKDLEYQSTTNADRLLLLRRSFRITKERFEIMSDLPFLRKGILDVQTSLF